MTARTIEELKKRGHKIGQTAITADGMNVIQIDDRMLTFYEIDDLLAADIEKESKP